jgi:hypothetical protein
MYADDVKLYSVVSTHDDSLLVEVALDELKDQCWIHRGGRSGRSPS